ncbi:MAG: DNA polymerase IV, partial [Alistipes sp.]|nr:DNA polymerase IV [Alistipes sp.]
IGEVTAAKMHRLGIRTGADLREWSREALIREFGKAGELYYGYARGEDRREVTPNRVRKSLGAEITFIDDIDNFADLLEELAAVRNEVWSRVKRHEFYGKTVVLKVKFSDFHQITRSKTLLTVIESYDTLQTVSNELLESINLENQKVRLLGLTIGNTPEPCAESIQLQFDFDNL